MGNEVNHIPSKELRVMVVDISCPKVLLSTMFHRTAVNVKINSTTFRSIFSVRIYTKRYDNIEI